jgi:hypothetical protein
MRFDDDPIFPDIVKRLPHVAFEVDDLHEAVRRKKMIIEPNEPAPGVLVAFIEEAGAPVEFLQSREKGALNPVATEEPDKSAASSVPTGAPVTPPTDTAIP